MVEPVGLTVGLLSLATLFSTCIDCFDFYKATKDCGDELRMLMRQLDLEEAQLLVWAEKVGLVHLDPQTRHAALEELEPAIRGALSEIKLLLTEANKVQDRFGLRATTSEDVTEEVENAVVSKNSTSIFRTNYNRFCTRFETRLAKPKFSLRLRWAITDGARFRGLVITLKDLIDSLYSLFSMTVDPQNDTIRDDIMEIIDLSELYIVEEACERSAYGVWSESARIAIDRTEAGTIDRRTGNPGEERVRYRGNDSNAVNPSASAVIEAPDFIKTPLGRPIKLFFMPTDPCMSYTGFCKENSFTNSQGSEGYEDGWTWGDIDDLMYRGPDVDGEYPIPRRLGTIFIHVAPCRRLIKTAVKLAAFSQHALWGYKIRIDDRLHSSCSHSISQNLERLQKLIVHLNSASPNLYGYAAIQYVDIEWLQRRLYYIEESEVALEENLEGFRQWRHIFDKSSYHDPPEDVAAIMIIGEEAQVTQIMSTPQFPTEARQPRAPEIYKMCTSGSAEPWKRYFIGTFVRNRDLKRLQNHVAPISPTASLTTNYQQPPSIVPSAGKKRKLGLSTSSQGYSEEEIVVG